ncbi:MAG: YjbH domain-containing protein, partial [Rhodothermales bacterium]
MTGSTGIILLSLLCYASAIRAQDLARPAQTDLIIHTLEDIGFENIRVAETRSRLIVSYENRRYRYEIRAFREAFASIAPYVGTSAPLTLIQERDGIPLRSVTVSSEGVDYERSGTDGKHVAAFVHSSLEVEDQWSQLGAASRHASSYGRFDLVLQPRITAQFGNYADAFQTQIGLMPELSSTIARGLRIRAQIILPIQNDLEEEGDYVRPGIVSIGQTLRLRDDAFVGLSAGYFTANRYGVDLQGKVYLADARFAVGGRMGLTGFAGIYDGTWTQSSLGRFTASITTDYFVPEYTLTVHSSFERFVYGDLGWR